jgi:hypothetical protein
MTQRSPGDQRDPPDRFGTAVRFGCGSMLGLAIWPIAVGRQFSVASPTSNVVRVIVLVLICGYCSAKWGDRFWRLFFNR